MYKQLTLEQQEKIIDTAVHEFAENGYTNSSISKIAKNSGVSVGVIYKYYEDKADLFVACIEKCISIIADSLQSVGEEGGDLYEMMRKVIRSNISFAKSNPDYIRLYHVITTGDTPLDAKTITMKIEKATADTYIGAIEGAIKEGEIRPDVTPATFAFFFDNLMMMLHFSYACDYYIERFKLYGGDDIADKDQLIEDRLMEFLRSGFGIA